MRRLAKKKNLKINEYGIFHTRTKKKIAGRREEDIYKVLGLAVVPPEMREDQGEIEAALKKKLPKLVKQEDILGDFHVHSKWSDGVNEIGVMAEMMSKPLSSSSPDGA